MSRSYQFSSQPQAVQTRTQNGPTQSKSRRNMMFDRRIKRGNTHAALVDNPFNSYQGQGSSSQSMNRTRALPKNRSGAPNFLPRRRRGEPSPRASPMFQNEPEEEEDMLEELPIPREALDFVDPHRIEDKIIPFVPKPQGTDAATHIAQGDLYDYDLSVEPVLQVLVGKCLEQSLAEVLALKESLFIQNRLDEFELSKQVGLATTKRLEAECLRKSEEKKRRLNQDREMKIRDRVIAHKLSARTAAAEFVVDLHSDVTNKLNEQGQFHNPVIQQVETTFLPWLLTEVQSRLNAVGECRATMDGLILNAINTSMIDANKALKLKDAAYKKAKKAYDDREREIERKAEEAKKLAEEEALKAEQARLLELAAAEE